MLLLLLQLGFLGLQYRNVRGMLSQFFPLLRFPGRQCDIRTSQHPYAASREAIDWFHIQRIYPPSQGQQQARAFSISAINQNQHVTTIKTKVGAKWRHVAQAAFSSWRLDWRRRCKSSKRSSMGVSWGLDDDSGGRGRCMARIGAWSFSHV
jgi:hypothetical protein